MKIALVIYSLSCGGAEVVGVTLANHWHAEGHEVVFLTMVSDGEKSFCKPASGVRVVSLGLASPSSSPVAGALANFRRVYTLRQTLQRERPDVVLALSTTTGILTTLAATGLKVPVVIVENRVAQRWQASRPWLLLRRLVYPRASRVVVLTNAAQEWFRRALGVATTKIPNPLRPEVDGYTGPPIAPERRERTGPFQIAWIGRLDPVKRLDLLFESVKRLKNKGMDFVLHIWGDGPLRASLEDLSHRLELGDAVRFEGLAGDIAAVYRGADLLVLTSEKESFSNVIIEAMANQVPVVAFAVPEGPVELIDHETNGLLVPFGDVEGFAGAVARLAERPDDYARLAQQGFQTSRAFTIAETGRRWHELFTELSCGAGSQSS